jgi:hypothetical protein
MRPCLSPGCPELVEPPERRCLDCEEGREHVAWVYADARWQPTRWACFKRDDFTCSCGHRDPSGRSLHAHHQPRLRFLLELGLDPFELTYLLTRCHGCHSRATVAETA